MDGVTMAFLAAVEALIISGRKASLHHSLQWLISNLHVLRTSPLCAHGTVNRSAVTKTICKPNMPLDRQYTPNLLLADFRA